MVGLSSLKYRVSSTVKKWLGNVLCTPAWGCLQPRCIAAMFWGRPCRFQYLEGNREKKMCQEGRGLLAAAGERTAQGSVVVGEMERWERGCQMRKAFIAVKS